MSKKTIHLSKILKFFALPENKLISELRTELRRERDRLDGSDEGGMDFYTPFWADAKDHVKGKAQLTELTTIRVEASGQRKNLYPKLCAGFLKWFDGLKRATNETVGWSDAKFHKHVEFSDMALVVKVDNLIGLEIGKDKFRLIYPYFAKAPPLSEQWARVGLWMMTEAFPDLSIVEMDVLDVLRGTGFRGANLSLKGNEEFLFRSRYEEILQMWNELRPEYGLP
ncbi:hypothetical protein [Erythrobacter sp. EC-HK427]|uniref:hypothetical protein n=1 Tax=Erythrobacter sp. EC-HK427 TaxID=2038396 RepID=UPI0012538089|nr:hypothetical protein [Erythrobacter sp. EC-HK427]VVT10158.1 conserved hypothetical protein [Erythrobacter sp. EC-HK427]